ncbi:phage baseplate assembly protein V, partial [Sediminispirochaeta bajacaliforniensis]|uniref:phage baseplate assembly protein V n=1 Tax=Sediminispirochaeta bajacaliforniensis TaxID=148 RepID=UPI0003827A6B
MRIGYRELQRIKTKYYDPANRTSRFIWHQWKDPRLKATATWGKVVDNHDPDGLGRVKVIAPLVFGDETPSPWIQCLSPWASKGYGIWSLPDIGDAVVVGFYLNNPNCPFVIGSVHTKRTPPYYEQDGANDKKYIRTRSGLEIMMNDKEGEEELVISAKEGKMRISLSSAGIQIVNELGDINIKCRKLTASSSQAIIKANANLKASSKGNVGLDASGDMSIKAGG